MIVVILVWTQGRKAPGNIPFIWTFLEAFKHYLHLSRHTYVLTRVSWQVYTQRISCTLPSRSLCPTCNFVAWPVMPRPGKS